jgi:hypothetical protein
LKEQSATHTTNTTRTGNCKPTCSIDLQEKNAAAGSCNVSTKVEDGLPSGKSGGGTARYAPAAEEKESMHGRRERAHAVGPTILTN